MSKIDVAVQVATAFKSWEDMKASMKKGYVPTLRTWITSHVPDKAFNDAVRIVRKECSRRKFKFYHDGKTYGK